MITLSFEAICTYYAAIFVIVILSLLYGSCTLLQCLAKDIANDLPKLNATIKDKHIDAAFFKTIKYHSELKQLCDPVTRRLFIRSSLLMDCDFRFVNDFNEVQQFIVFDFFVYILCALCCSIFVMQLELVKYRQQINHLEKKSLHALLCCSSFF